MMSDILFARMMSADSVAVRGAIKRWATVMLQRRKSAREALESDGWEVVDTASDAVMTDDGRVINHNAGVPMALRPEAHAERLAAAFAAAKQARPEPEPETKSVVGTESLSAMTCPKCGDSLQHTAVCPKCAAGKLGYRHRYTCVCGGVDLISREAL